MSSDQQYTGKSFRRSWADMNSDDSSMGAQLPALTRRKDDVGCNSLQLPKATKSSGSNFSVVCDDSYAPGSGNIADAENRKNMLNEAFRSVGISKASGQAPGGGISCFGFLLPKSEETFEGDTRSRMVGTSSEESKLGKRLLSAVSGGQSDFSAMMQNHPTEHDPTHSHASKFRKTDDDMLGTNNQRHATSFMSVDPIAPTRKTVSDGLEKSKVLNSKRLNSSNSASVAEDQEWEARFQQREKQIDLTKKSKGYLAYISKVPTDSRSHNDPQTPSGREMCSKRQFDGKLLKWRKGLRQYDVGAGTDEAMSQ
jgi:hypothetical protein